MPSIRGHAPRRAFGGCSKESKVIHWGIELPISFPAGPVSMGVTPSNSVDTAKEVEHAFTITGTARGVPHRTNCVWTVEENKSSHRGIPTEIQFAAVVDYDNPFICEVNMSGRSGGIFPRWLRARAPNTQRQSPIDPAKYKGLLREYDFEDDSTALEALLMNWTGEVSGAVVHFSQQIGGP